MESAKQIHFTPIQLRWNLVILALCLLLTFLFWWFSIQYTDRQISAEAESQSIRITRDFKRSFTPYVQFSNAVKSYLITTTDYESISRYLSETQTVNKDLVVSNLFIVTENDDTYSVLYSTLPEGTEFQNSDYYKISDETITNIFTQSDVALSAPFTTVTSEKPHVLMVTPYTHDGLWGYIVVDIQYEYFLSDVIRYTSGTISDSGITIYGDSQIEDGYVSTISYAGRTFTVTTRGIFENGDTYWFLTNLPIIVLSSGIFLSVLLFVVLYTLSASHDNAVELAEMMTSKLRESEARFKNYLDNASIVSWLTDSDKGYVYVNKVFKNAFSISELTLKEKSIADSLGNELIQTLNQKDSEVLSTNSPVQFYLSVPTASGVKDWLVFKFPVAISQEKMLVGATAIDITTQKQTEEALRLEHDRSTAIITSIGEGVLVVDRSKNILVMNPVAQKLLEVTDVSKVIGQNWSELATTIKNGEPLAYAERSFSRALSTGSQIVTTIDDNHSYRTRSGKTFPISSTTTPLTSNGVIVGAVKVFRDISEEKEQKLIIEDAVKVRTREFKEEEAKLQASIESLSVGFILTDEKGNIMQINSAAKRIICMAQYTQDSGVVSLTADVMQDCNLEKIESSLKGVVNFKETVQSAIKDKKPFEFKNLTLGTQFLHLYFSPVILFEDNFRVIGTVVLVQDETEEKIVERSKDEFFSIASHELRTPLTAIRGNAAMIRDYYMNQLPDDSVKEMVTDIHASSTRLIGIVNDFLDISRLEQGKIKFTIAPMDMVEILDSCCTELEAAIKEKNLNLICQKPTNELPQVMGDKERIKQVVINLVGNAIKFTDAGGTITITPETSGNFVSVSVTDSGRGIPLENQQLLFRKFQQAGSSLFTRDTTKGTGLGLYISKMIVTGMGGTIQLVKSEPDKGTTFAFKLPIVS